MGNNTVGLLNNYPFDIIKLDLSRKQINGILNLDKFSNLTELDCRENKITKLDNLPNSLTKLDCEKNQITNLDNLPNSLTVLNNVKVVKK